jgi:hypothetical protein
VSGGTPEETAALANAMATVGAFPLDEDSADAALVVEVGAGGVTFLVSGRDGTTGIVLVEVYEMPVP